MSACEKCDAARRNEGREFDIGKVCDICAGSGTDYIGRPCRHCAPKASPAWLSEFS